MTLSRTRFFQFLAAFLVVLSFFVLAFLRGFEIWSTWAGPSNSSESPLGSFKVGDRGPGGGIVFFVSDTRFPCGAELEKECTYLEAAPYGWNKGYRFTSTLDDPSAPWSYNLLVGTKTGLGFGYQNTLAAVAQNSTPGTAIMFADSYSSNSKADWFLPSKDELNELCKYARRQTTGDTSVACARSGLLSLILPPRNGFMDDYYWSSSVSNAAFAWSHSFGHGYHVGSIKTSSLRVRPVRAG